MYVIVYLPTSRCTNQHQTLLEWWLWYAYPWPEDNGLPDHQEQGGVRDRRFSHLVPVAPDISGHRFHGDQPRPGADGPTEHSVSHPPAELSSTASQGYLFVPFLERSQGQLRWCFLETGCVCNVFCWLMVICNDILLIVLIFIQPFSKAVGWVLGIVSLCFGRKQHGFWINFLLGKTGSVVLSYL